MNIDSAITFLITTIFFALSPGPGVFAVIATTLLNGTRAAFPIIAGIIASDCIYLLLACYGMALIAETWSQAFTVIRYLGGFYLIYLGWKMWITPVEEGFEAKISEQGRQRFVQGFWISASNPKVIVFYLTLLPLLFDLESLNAVGFLTAATLTALGLMLGLLLVATSASSVRGYVSQAGYTRHLNKTSGVVMAGAGAYLAARQ